MGYSCIGAFCHVSEHNSRDVIAYTGCHAPGVSDDMSAWLHIILHDKWGDVCNKVFFVKSCLDRSFMAANTCNMHICHVPNIVSIIRFACTWPIQVYALVAKPNSVRECLCSLIYLTPGGPNLESSLSVSAFRYLRRSAQSSMSVTGSRGVLPKARVARVGLWKLLLSISMAALLGALHSSAVPHALLPFLDVIFRAW